MIYTPWLEQKKLLYSKLLDSIWTAPEVVCITVISYYETDGDPIVLDCPQIPDEEHHPILREEVLKMGKSAGMDNIPAELVQAGWSHDGHPDRNLQQDLEDRRMADHMDSVPNYHTPKERQLAAVLELQNHRPYQPS